MSVFLAAHIDILALMGFILKVFTGKLVFTSRVLDSHSVPERE